MPRPVKRAPDQADFLSAPKIAKELGVNQRTVTNWAAAGLIRVSTTGGVDAAAVCALLRAVAAAGLGWPVTLVLDNARYQHTAAVKALARALGIELLYLPSYSPNLNLIERLWRFVKQEAVASRYRPTFAEFQGAIDDCLDHLNTRYRDQTESLLTLNFQTFGDEPVLAA